MQVHVNRELRSLPSACPLAALVNELGLAEAGGLAIAVNERVVPRAQWGSTCLAEGDRVTVIRATQGG